MAGLSLSWLLDLSSQDPGLESQYWECAVWKQTQHTLTTKGKKIVKPCGGILERMLNGSTHHNFQSLTASTISRLDSLCVLSRLAAESTTMRLSAYARSLGFRNHAVPGLLASQNGVT